MSINDNIDLVKRALDIKTELARVGDKEALVEAKSALVDIKEQLLELRSENIGLKSRLTQRDDYVLDQAVYWQKDDTERTQPFCPNCMVKGLAMPMSPNEAGTKVAYFSCPNPDCKFGKDLNGYRSGDAVISHSGSFFDGSQIF